MAITVGSTQRVTSRPRAGWFALRWERVILTLLAVTVVLRATIASGIDPDLWWHLRTGQIILHHGVPTTDAFSWTATGKPWVAHEWLSELLIYCAQAVLGYAAVAAIFAGIVLGSLWLMYSLARRRGADTRALCMTLIIATVTITLFTTVRPQVLTWFLFALFVVILERDEAGEAAPTWLLPPLMLLWANLHLGFVYGLMAIAIWVTVRLYERFRGHGRSLVGPLAIAAASAAVVALNPAGLALYTYPLRYSADAHALGIVAEWRRPNPVIPLEWPYFIGVVLLTWTLVSRERPRPFLMLLSVAVIVMSVQAIRNAPFVALILPAVVAPAITARASRAARPRSRAVPRSYALMAASVCALVVAVGFTASSFSPGAPTESGTPARAVDYIDAHYAGAHLYNDYDWGGYLIYKHVPVFIDGRTDFYRAPMIGDYATIGRVEPGWQQLVASYGIDLMLLRPQSHLARTLRTQPGWREVYSDDTASVFALRSAWQ